MPVRCSQCGSPLEAPPGERFGACAYCGSPVYYDRTSALQHFLVKETLDERQALGKLRAWMAGNETVKGLEAEARIEAPQLSFFPVWRIVTRDGPTEREWTRPARAELLSGLSSLSFSAGGLVDATPEAIEGRMLLDPELSLDAALSSITRRDASPGTVRETSLVHVPFYAFDYTYRGDRFRAVVEGVSGRVLAAAFPAKPEMPFRSAAAIVAIVFLAIGLLAPDAGSRLILFSLFAVPLFLFARRTARRN